MALDGTYIPNANTGSSRKNKIMDSMLSYRLERFRQLVVHDEEINAAKNSLQSIWYPWLPEAPIHGMRNSLVVGEEPAAGTITVNNATMGLFSVSPELERGETLFITYTFDYFPDPVLSGLMEIALDILNSAEPGTNFDFQSAPAKWDGAIAEQTYVLALEKLLLDDLLWRTRLIFADPDSVAGQLEAVKDESQDRLNNIVLPGLKKEPYVSSPTWVYYDAIRLGGGRSGFHGEHVGYGRTRGLRINRWFGR
jgi:hypothetical protein